MSTESVLLPRMGRKPIWIWVIMNAFLNLPTSQANNVTTKTGVLQSVIEKERQGAFLGKTVQVIPHITNEIKERMQLLAQNGDYDIIITEIGGTVGTLKPGPILRRYANWCTNWAMTTH